MTSRAMKTIIAGSRGIDNHQIVQQAIVDSGFNITEVISGSARGVDQLGEQWAVRNFIPLAKYPADWDGHGKSAGYIRNAEMLKVADALIAIHDGKSKGTAHMIRIAKNSGLKVYVHTV